MVYVDKVKADRGLTDPNLSRLRIRHLDIFPMKDFRTAGLMDTYGVTADTHDLSLV
jgi:hypothetical protein